MRDYKDDCPVKIPNWYLKLPTKVIDWISDTGLTLNHFLFGRKRTGRTK